MTSIREVWKERFLYGNHKLKLVASGAALTVDHVAELVGKDRTTIWRYENGITPMTIEMLFQLLNIYKLSIMDVVVTEGGDAH